MGDETAPRVGILGLGRMGLPIARRLRDAGRVVVAFDPDPAARARADDTGITWADSAAGVTSVCDALLTVLPDGRAVHDARADILRLRPASLWVDLSSGDPRLSESDHSAAREAGIRPVSAPMTGGPAEGTSGGRGFLLSGDADDVRDARAVLAPLASPDGVHEVGDRPGDAQLVKLLGNLLWFGQVIAATEALLLGARSGLEAGTLRRVLASGPGGSVVLDQHVDRLIAGDYLEDFALDRCVDELRTVVELAHEAGTPAELSELVLQTHEQALDRFGPVLGELLAARLLEERAGIDLRA